MSNLTSYRGDTYTVNLTFKDANAVAVDITGWTVFMTIKSKESDADGSAVVSKTVTSHSDATGGLTSIELSATDTASLAGNYFYDIQYKTDTGTIKTVDKGLFNFKVDITRRTS